MKNLFSIIFQFLILIKYFSFSCDGSKIKIWIRRIIVVNSLLAEVLNLYTILGGSPANFIKKRV